MRIRLRCAWALPTTLLIGNWLNSETVVIAATVAVVKVPLGSFCHETSMCSTSAAECRRQRCICPPDFYQLDHECSTCLSSSQWRLQTLKPRPHPSSRFITLFPDPFFSIVFPSLPYPRFFLPLLSPLFPFSSSLLVPLLGLSQPPFSSFPVPSPPLLFISWPLALT